MYFIRDVCLPAFIPPKDTKSITLTQMFFFFLPLSIMLLSMMYFYMLHSATDVLMMVKLL